MNMYLVINHMYHLNILMIGLEVKMVKSRDLIFSIEIGLEYKNNEII